MLDVKTSIPSYIYITNASVHDVNILDATEIALLYKYWWRIELFFYGKQKIMQSSIMKHAHNQPINHCTLQYHFA